VEASPAISEANGLQVKMVTSGERGDKRPVASPEQKG
jgi:hypothetical protein